MAFEIATPTDEQWPETMRADARGFGFIPSDDEIRDRRPTMDLDRFRIAVDDGRIIGVAGSFAFDVTVPGGTTVPMSGITWVSVSATHRRQGVLTALLDACHADTDERGEPVAMLFASEGGIYQRFGYGVATHFRGLTIDRHLARLRPDLDVAAAGPVRYLEPDEAEGHEAAVWERVRRTRAGEVSRSAVWSASRAASLAKADGDYSAAFHLAHADGYAIYRIKPQWGTGVPNHVLQLVEMAAATPDAHLALWNTILGVDLVGSILAHTLPADEPLPYLLTNGRAVSTTVLADSLWVNVRDVATCFTARAYGTADRLVVECEGRRWAVESDGSESSCRSVRTRPDLVVDRPSLGAMLLGGVRPTQLVAGRRATARSADVLRRADAFFVVGPAPHSTTFF
jgi:predicted acetyltransferase